MKVLLVEDNTDHSFLTKCAFDEHAHEFALTIARSGAEAIEALEENPFDIAFVDHNLPDMPGLQVMKEINSIHPRLPFVITTGQGSEELAVDMFREGAVDYIIKSKDYFQILPSVALRIMRTKAQLNGKLTRPSLSAEHVYEQILSASADLLDVQASSLMLYDENKGHLETKAVLGLSHNYLSQVRPKLGESLEGKAVVKAKVILSENIHDEPGYQFKDLATNEGIRSAMSVPFAIDQSTRGVLNFYSDTEGRFQSTDEVLAASIIKLSKLALQNLKMWRREHKIAETLQMSHFPEIAKRFDDWEIAHRYRVSMEEAMLGGDFYDMFTVPGDKRALVVADVSGKGINAAAQTAMVKYTLRSYALDDPDPGTVLSRTHEAFCSFMTSEHFVTIFYGLIDPKEQTMSYCSAGHPPALFYSAQPEKVFSFSDVYMPVGAWHENVCYAGSTIAFSPGDTLLVYTDGLPDCRRLGHRNGDFFGHRGVVDLFARLVPEKAEAIASGMIKEIERFSAGKMRDDLAFFILKLRESC